MSEPEATHNLDPAPVSTWRPLAGVGGAVGGLALVAFALVAMSGMGDAVEGLAGTKKVISQGLVGVGLVVAALGAGTFARNRYCAWVQALILGLLGLMFAKAGGVTALIGGGVLALAAASVMAAREIKVVNAWRNAP